LAHRLGHDADLTRVARLQQLAAVAMARGAMEQTVDGIAE